MNYTDNLKLRKPEGGEYYDVEDFNKNSDLLDTAVNSKANKPQSATAGNFPMLDAGGNLGDSGKSASSFAAANHDHDAAYAPVAHTSDTTIHIGEAEKAAIAAVSDKADRTYVDEQLSHKANKSTFCWHNVMLNDGWAVYNDRVFQIAKTDYNDVHIFGTIKKNSTPYTGEIVAVLPEEFRPKVAAVFPTFFVSDFGLELTGFRLEKNGNLIVHPNCLQTDLDTYQVGGGININYSYPAQ